jgi:hypothetical protein
MGQQKLTDGLKPPGRTKKQERYFPNANNLCMLQRVSTNILKGVGLKRHGCT